MKNAPFLLDKDVAELDLPQVKSTALAYVVEYMTHYEGIELAPLEGPIRSKFMKDVVKVLFFWSFSRLKKN